MFTEHENEWSGFLKETIRYKNPPILSALRALNSGLVLQKNLDKMFFYPNFCFMF